MPVGGSAAYGPIRRRCASMTGLPARFQPAIERDACRGGVGLRGRRVYLRCLAGGGLALCLLVALGCYLGCTVRARRIAAGWKRAGVVFLPEAEGLVEYDGAVHDPASPPGGGDG